MKKILIVVAMFCLSTLVLGCESVSSTNSTDNTTVSNTSSSSVTTNTQQEVIVFFNSNGGSSVSSIRQDYNSSVDEPEAPIKAGYTFAGWYTDEELLSLFDFNSNIQCDIRLYAKWSDIKPLNWNIGAEPMTIDPALNGDASGGGVINQTFEGLVREIDGIVYPGIASSWEISQDGLTITFHLRDSKWSDGSDLTANDFVYSFKRGMDPATASQYAWIWEYTNIVGAAEVVYDGGSLDDVGIDATDDYTLVITLNQPTLYLVSLMSLFHFMPVKQSVVEATGGYGDGLWASTPEDVVSNGPFILTKYTYEEGLVLEKNEYYWNSDNVYISRINGYFIESYDTAYLAFMEEELDVIPHVPSSVIQGNLQINPEFYQFPLLGTYYVNFNMDDELFSNINLRKALAYAINREEIVASLNDGQIPAIGIVSPAFIDNNEEDFATNAGNFGIATDDSNYALAVSLFAQAASELEMTVELLQAAVSSKTYLYNTSMANSQVGLMLQASWADVLGIDIVLQNQEWTIFKNSCRDGFFDLSRGYWQADYLDPYGMLSIFCSDDYYNDPNYSNEAFDTLIEEALSTTDPNIHYEKLYEAQAVFMSDMPIIPIYYSSDILMVQDYVIGWGRSAFGAIDFSKAYFVD